MYTYIYICTPWKSSRVYYILYIYIFKLLSLCENSPTQKTGFGRLFQGSFEDWSTWNWNQGDGFGRLLGKFVGKI